MADPGTMAIASAGTSILGGIFGASGASKAGAAAKQQNLYQAGVSLLNAQIAEQNSEYALNQGEQSAQRFGMKSAFEGGQIVANQSASGIDVNSGSAKRVQDSQHLVSTMDMDQIRANAAKTAYDYKVQATGFRNSANLYAMGATNAASAASTNVASSLIGSATSVATKWSQASQVGLFGGGGGGIDLGTGGFPFDFGVV